MVSRSPSFLAAILLTAAAGFAAAQQAQQAQQSQQANAASTVESTESLNSAPASVPSGTVVTSQLEGSIPDSAAVDTGDGARTTMLVGEWMLAGVLIFALFVIITRIRRRQFERGPIMGFTPLSPKLKPAPIKRSYGPRPA